MVKSKSIAILVALAIFATALLPVSALCEAGVLVPYGGSYDPDKLRLENMDVRIEIDNQLATVSVLQIYRSGSGGNMEGQYTFIIPEAALISSFAIWDDGVRIPGVIIEKQRARRIYEEIVRRESDPGLFESVDDESMVNEFSCRVFPIPAYGTKRLELEYTQLLDADTGVSTLLFPLQPTIYGKQSADHLNIEVTINNQLGMKNFTVRSEAYPMQIETEEPNRIELSFEGRDVDFTENLVLQYEPDTEGSVLDVLAFRDVESVYRDISPDGGLNYKDEYGYLFAKAYFDLGADSQGSSEGRSGPRHLVFLVDTSLSMQWDKMDRALDAVDYFLNGLGPEDSFNLICFNSDQYQYAEDRDALSVSPDEVAKAMNFIKSQPMSGATDIQGALEYGLDLAVKDRPNTLIMISDGHPTLEQIKAQEIIDWFDRTNSAGAQARMFAFGIGDDANGSFLERLVVQSDGAFMWVMNTENIVYKAERFSKKLEQDVIGNVALKAADASNIVDLYPGGPVKTFDRSMVFFVGRYREPGSTTMSVSADYHGQSKEVTAEVDLPDKDVSHPGIRRQWAKARVDYLLDKIRLEGEKEEWVQEIIALSKQFTFVTPYTSFLAAPRSLLRPRVIKPGDPVLRVHTHEAIVEVVASFPFGLVKPMEQLEPGLWQIRFLAPAQMADGSYVCRLYLKDRDGNQYVEDKGFVIDSRPPELEVVDPGPVRPGELVKLVVYADRDTRHLTARLPGGPVARLQWDPDEKACIGALKVPRELPQGSALLEVFAEDFAHNTTSREVSLEVIR